ncbi:hypothetical protein [Ramlibacter albus]|uniref:Uncharacterized protein n=1 Tax=Ramlibacter albus TaxID=2079448 RepID=A0A923MBP8_9BURK|nr:hypothetical protein [Ramlibacter albus]MBC5767715.1 hypothetical protein [Ramlibacter albus]
METTNRNAETARICREAFRRAHQLRRESHDELVKAMLAALAGPLHAVHALLPRRNQKRPA